MKVALGRRITTGILNGFEAWMSYGIMEYICGMIVPVLLHRNGVMMTAQWRGMVFLLGTYAIIGMLLGALSAFVIPGYDYLERRSRKLLVLSVVVTFSVFCIQPFNAGAIAWIPAVLLIVYAVLRDIGGTSERLGVAGKPWVVYTVLILSSTCAHRTSSVFMILLAFALAVAAGVFAVYLALQRLLEMVAPRWATAPALRHAFTLTLVLGLSFGPNLRAAWMTAGDPDVRPSGAARGRPNIILVTLDTVRADHMGLYGYERKNTPKLEALAQQSTLYSRFMAAAPVTLTSHASIFTGLYPQSHGAYPDRPGFDRGRPLPSNIPTAASLLSAAGYRTLAIVANRYYLRPEFGMFHGFQFSSAPNPESLVSDVNFFLLRNPVRRYLLRFNGAAQGLDAQCVDASEVNSEAFDLLRKAAHWQSPFFLFLNYTDAHAPYVTPAPYSQMYPGRDGSFIGADYAQLDADVNVNGLPLNPRVKAHMLSQYDGAIAYLDAAMGDLVDELKRDRLYDNTLIIITSDHGEAFGEQGWVMHNVSLEQPALHIPLIVKYPNQTAPDRVDALASHVDLLPTMLEVAGLKAPAAVEGIPLSQVVHQPDRAIVAEYHNSTPHPQNRLDRTDFALFHGTQKMIYSTNGSRSLFDLSADPREEHNLYRAGDSLVASLRVRLEQWSRATVPLFNSAQMPDAKTVKALESLGYAR